MIDWDAKWQEIEAREQERLGAEREEYSEPFPWVSLLILAGYFGLIAWALISWAYDS